MKTILNYTLVLLAGLSIALSCSKINEIDVVEPEKEGTEASVGKQITIKATISDALTRVQYTYDENGPKLSLNWEETDILVVSNPRDPCFERRFLRIIHPDVSEDFYKHVLIHFLSIHHCRQHSRHLCEDVVAVALERHSLSFGALLP